MQLKQLNIPAQAEPIPKSASSSDLDLIIRSVDLMDKSMWLGKVTDVNNIVFGESDTVDSISETVPHYLGEFRTNPYSLEYTSEGTRLRVRGVLRTPHEGTVADLLSQYNVIILNGSISDTIFGGFLVFTIGSEGSGSDIELSADNILEGNLTLALNILSGVIL